MTDPLHKKVAQFISAESDFGRSVFLPPGVSAERVEALRKAFDATMKDPAFLDYAKKLALVIEPMSHQELERLTERVVNAPKEVLEFAK